MKYVILGASAAGISAAKTLRELDKESEICMVSEDEFIYSRCMLHHLISGKRDIENLNFVEKDFFKEKDILWLFGKKVKKVDVSQKQIVFQDHGCLSFDKLLIATGASSFIPSIKNLREAKGVFGLRNLQDAISIREKVNFSKSALIIGAGLVGIDAIFGLLEKDITLSIVEISNRLLPMQLDNKASYKYEKLLKEHGVNVYTSNGLQEVEIDDNQKITGAILKNGQKISCDMIIVAAGIRPNTDIINEDEISLNRGIVINEKCETSAKDVYAAGDVTGRTPIWTIAVKQGKVAAYNMAGVEKICDDSFALKNSMNFLGLDTISLGLVTELDESYSVDVIETQNTYKKIISKDGILYGAILQGDTSYSGALMYLIKNKVDISTIHKSIFEIDYADFFNLQPNGEYYYNPI